MNILAQNIKTMSSREIAELCGKEHRNVCRDIDTLNENYAQMGLLKVEQGYYTLQNTGNQQHRQFLLSKEQTIDLITGYRADIRIRINRRWQELEASASQPVVALPHDYISALEELLVTKNGEQAALEQVKDLQPKAAALDTLSHARGSLGIRETAKAVGIPEREFVKRCLDKSKPMSSRFLYRDDNGRLNAHAHRIKQGFMTQKLGSYADKDGHDFATVQVKFTAAGVAHIAKLMQNKSSGQLRVV
ncbi:phage antirepressor KilAC domain-containing protein [Psychrobacter aquimaris]|uniref:phage antirepressor KilAC domain-containing protein n=1 Tax=Psychrobacter aquimaris TaxID=292733 RepID=UPI0018DF1902|nr:phage regulatory protein/antirepressor Ant [Psychrobacter aquimaris]